MRGKGGWILLAAAPILIGVLFVAIELFLANQLAVDDALDGRLPETVRQVVALNNDLARLFISLSTAVIGGVAYYLKLAYKEFSEPTRLSRWAAAGTLICAALSIFFGHLWVVGMRNQLANDYFNPARAELVWPERLQYYAFIVALCWFAVLALDREQARGGASISGK
jgi:TRAP-type C4-dicarboxylate transport system permease small subunit